MHQFPIYDYMRVNLLSSAEYICSCNSLEDSVGAERGDEADKGQSFDQVGHHGQGVEGEVPDGAMGAKECTY